MRKKQIVILGGGFGGLRAALNIEKELRRLNLLTKYEVVLVDKNNAHEYIPLLYEIATYTEEAYCGKKLKELVLYPFRELLRGRAITFIEDEVLDTDISGGRVRARKQEISFDYLILAMGSEENYFGIPGAKEHSFSIKTFGKALRARSAIYEAHQNHGRNARILVGGGGATGVEIAAEIKNWLPALSVTLLDSGEQILSGFSRVVCKKVLSRLRRLGVRVVSEYRMKEVSPEEVTATDGRKIAFDVFLWTAGVRAMCKERISVSEELKIQEKIYAIGDISCIPSAPMLAAIAIDEALLVSKNIIEDIKKEEGITRKALAFRYTPKKKYPYVIPLGGKFAVAEIGPFVVSGYPAWVLKGLVELRYLLTLMPLPKALHVWWRGFWFFVRNDRLG